jgi:hypothetical protein
MNDKKLWKVFSEYIRLRDSDENGYCSCFTCGRWAYWKHGDCGHGLSRQHMATKYNEKNNHFQCKPCNGFHGGKREVYKEKMNERYGPQTWELMELLSKKDSTWTQFEVDQLEKYYAKKVKILKASKTIP